MNKVRLVFMLSRWYFVIENSEGQVTTAIVDEKERFRILEEILDSIKP
jgi:hypothetical protein